MCRERISMVSDDQKHRYYEYWHPGELERLPAMITRIWADLKKHKDPPARSDQEEAQAAEDHRILQEIQQRAEWSLSQDPAEEPYREAARDRRRIPTVEEMVAHEREKYALLDAEDEPDYILETPAETLPEIRRVLEERIRQAEIWGVQRVSMAEWGLILGEEYGEAIQDATQLHFSPAEKLAPNERRRRMIDLRRELSHTAAVSIAWMEHISEMLQELEEEER
jgi:hypothetical protein